MIRAFVCLAGAATAALFVASTAGAADWKGSFDASYQAAQPGDVVTVPAGSYPAQTIAYDAAKEGASGRVVFSAAGVSVASLTILGAQHMEVRGLTISGLWNVRPSTNNSWLQSSRPASDLLFDGITAKTFLWRNVVGLTLRDSRIGGQNVSTSGLGVPKVGAYPAEGGAREQPSTGVVIERTLFADIIRTVEGSTHAECFYFDAGVDDATIRDSVFTNCGVFDIFSNGDVSGRPITNVLIEGNLLDVPRDLTGGAAGSAINFKGGAGKVTLRGNSILGNVRRDADSYQWTSSANAIGGTGGSTSDVMAGDPGFVSASKAACNLSSCFRNDLHVRADSAAGRAGAGVPQQDTPPPPPPPPPPVCPGSTLPLTVVAQDATTVTLGWTPPNGVEWYTFWTSGSPAGAATRVSNGPAVLEDGTVRRTARFARVPAGGCYRVDALGVIASGGSAG